MDKFSAQPEPRAWRYVPAWKDQLACSAPYTSNSYSSVPGQGYSGGGDGFDIL